MKFRRMKCCICKDYIDIQFNGYMKGHNAEPVKYGRCCSNCNGTVVMPQRIKDILEARKNER